MTTQQETIETLTVWMQARNLPIEMLRAIERAARATPPAGVEPATMNLVGIAVRRVVRKRVDAELADKSDDELRRIAAKLTNAQGNYVDRLIGPAQGDALQELAKVRHPEAAAEVEAWELADDNLDAGPMLRRYERLGSFDYYATTAGLS